MNDPDYEREIAQEAYVEGRDHGHSGMPNCPHIMGCTEHRHWWRGYHAAKANEANAKELNNGY